MKVYFSSLYFGLYIQIVKIRLGYNVSNNKIKKKTQLSQRTFQSHLTCWYTKMCTLIRHTITERFMNARLLCMKTHKNATESRDLQNLQLRLTYQYIEICVLTRHTLYKSLMKLCITKHKCCSFLRYYF